MININAVKDFARKNGYDNAIYKGVWNGYQVYEPTFDGEGMQCIGLPFFILLNKTELRMCEQHECLTILSALNNKRK